MKFILNILASALIVFVLAKFIPGVEIKDFTTSIIVFIVLSICNMLVKPILILLTLPITILTLGLFLLVINVIIIYITDALISGFQVNGFFSALIFSLLFSLFNSISHKLIDNKEE